MGKKESIRALDEIVACESILYCHRGSQDLNKDDVNVAYFQIFITMSDLLSRESVRRSELQASGQMSQ